MMKHLFLLSILLLPICTFSQGRPWTEWDSKETNRILNESAWAQSQTEGSRTKLTFRIRLFSAKPVREAFARNLLIKNSAVKPEQLNGFINGDFSEAIIVAFSFGSSDPKLAAPIVQRFTSASTDTLRDKSYLESLKNRKRVQLSEYVAPTPDGTGAKLVFPRLVDGKPFLDGEEGFSIVMELEGGLKLDRKFRFSDMAYNGRPEY